MAECSQLQLFLLAAMVRLEQRNLQVFNFEVGRVAMYPGWPHREYQARKRCLALAISG